MDAAAPADRPISGYAPSAAVAKFPTGSPSPAVAASSTLEWDGPQWSPWRRRDRRPSTSLAVAYVETHLRSSLCLLAISLAVLFVGVGLSFGTPRVVPFYVNDASHWRPHRPNTVPSLTLFLVGLLVSLPIMVLYDYWVYTQRESRTAPWTHVLGYISAFGWTLMSTQWIKLWAGRLRPDFGVRCLGSGFFPPSNYSALVITSNAQCALGGSSESTLNHGRMSFVSGHSSTAMVFATYLAVFLTRRAQALHPPRARWLLVNGMYVLAMVAVALGVAVCISRLVDNRHFPADVVGGGLLGAGYALGVFFMFDANVVVHYPPQPISLPQVMDGTLPEDVV